VRNGFCGSHSLCHGALGSVDAMRLGSVALGTRPSADDTRLVTRLVARVAASIAQRGPVCGTPHAVETPGLMTGLAGIGYGLLRLAAPDCVPSVLTLAPPVSSPRRSRIAAAASGRGAAGSP